MSDAERRARYTLRTNVAQRRLQDPHESRAKREANNHGGAKRQSHLHDGPSQVFKMFEKRLRSFALRPVAKFKDVSQRHGWEESTRPQRQKAARRQRRANAQRIGVANFVLRNHAANFIHSKFTAIENRFSFVSRRSLFTPLN